MSPFTFFIVMMAMYIAIIGVIASVLGFGAILAYKIFKKFKGSGDVR